MQRIGPGDSGPAVADVQRRLGALGVAIDDEPGTYGPGTTQAVREFQRERRLMAHGTVDEDTWTSLLDASHALGDRLLYLTRPPLRGDDVRQLQLALSRLGFDIGATDGVHGDATDAGLRDFQHNAGLVVDGIAGASTLQLLASLRRHHQHATAFEVLEAAIDAGRDSLSRRRVAVDPALTHGDHVVAPGLTARDVVDDVARRLVGQLVARGGHAVLTTYGAGGERRSVHDRAALTNELDVDAVVSVGCTLVPQSAAHGVTGHHFGDGTVTSRRGRRLAMLCVDAVTAATGTLNCDVHPSTATLLRTSRAPAVTIEVGFLSNAHELERLADPAHRHVIATALADAVQRWVEEPATG